jgi:hypothetical protein
MRIEGILVSVNYSDFLEQVLPFNIPHFDNLIVITTPEDSRTQHVCRRLGVECVKTNVFYRNNAKFNKAAGINYGLAQLAQKDWIVHLDSDIVLPINFRKFVANAELSSLNIYGMDRVECDSFEKWQNYKMNGELQYEWSCLVKPPNKFPIGARIAHGTYGGYCPLGFFQMWHADSKILRYPSGGSESAEHSDILHSIQFDRNRRILLPEMYAIHLSTKPKDSKSFGPNWGGRVTPTFSSTEEPFELCNKIVPITTKGAFENNNYYGSALK